MRISAWALVASVASGLLVAANGCGSSNSSEFQPIDGPDTGAGASTSGVPGSSGTIIGGTSGNVEGGTPASGAIAVLPTDVQIQVNAVDGVHAAIAPITFTIIDKATQAPLDGASWSIDRGELGTIVANTGVFTANGDAAGTVTVTASKGGTQASTTVTVKIVATNNGANAKSGTGPQSGAVPKGGFNGVGGQVLGPKPSAAIKAKLDIDNPVTTSKFDMLAPYDKTVFPRGILPPLVQWQTNGGFKATGYTIHLKQNGYEFRGYYGVPAGADAITSAPIDAQVWKALTNGNSGDPVTVEIKVTDGTTTYGPVTRTWSVAPGILRGTVYYNSYGTLLAQIKKGHKAAAVLKINPGDFEPGLAVPGADQKCVVCHEVSANGNRLFSNDSDTDGEFGYARAYDLTNNAAILKRYGPEWTPASEFSKDAFVGKLSYSGPYPDGTFFMASHEVNYHAWGGDSDLFSADTYQQVPTEGFTDVVKYLASPAFSPDGKRIAFTFLEARDTATDVQKGLANKDGHSLVVMDFDCKADAKGACGAPPYKFSNMRRVAKHDDGYLGWPSFSPDGKWLIYQRSTHKGAGGPLNTSQNPKDTTESGRADLWIASAEASAAFTPMLLCGVNGFAGDCITKGSAAASFLPSSDDHPQKLVSDTKPGDTNVNFEPSITPIVSGGYAWLVFTTRRLYGNVATLEPYAGKDDDAPMPASPVTKKLWVAAIELSPKSGTDPSHPPFYLPGQELLAGNMHAFWENEACRANGSTCETGNECCNGFCRADSGGKLVCGDKPPGCVQEFETCTSTSECCSPGLQCIAGKCAVTEPGVH